MDDLLPARPNETDDERRLREAMNRHLGAAMSTLDHAIKLRTAPGDVKRMRHLMRTDLIQAGHKALHAQTLLTTPE